MVQRSWGGLATYAETLARELGLYSSEYEVIDALMSSTTPSMVADLGMQVMNWTSEQATDYLLEELPLRDAERVRRLTETITGASGLATAYPLGPCSSNRCVLRRRVISPPVSMFESSIN